MPDSSGPLTRVVDAPATRGFREMSAYALKKFCTACMDVGTGRPPYIER